MTNAGTSLFAAALPPAKLCPRGDSSAGETRGPHASEDAGWGCASGSTWIGRFLNGSLEEGLSAGRLWEAPPSPSGSASLTRPLLFGVPRSRLVVRRSNGAAASRWWSPFMVMVPGTRRHDLQVFARRRSLTLRWDHPNYPVLRNRHPI